MAILDTLGSLTLQFQNHKKPLTSLQKKLFHLFIRKAWGKMEKEPQTFHFAKVIPPFLSENIMWKLFSPKTDFTEFLLVKIQVLAKFES